MTSVRFEDLKEELNQLKNRIAVKLKQGITEGVLNNFLTEGDQLMKQIQIELKEIPNIAKRDMYDMFSEVNNGWSEFKVNCKTNPAAIIGGPSVLIDMPSSSNSNFVYPQSTNNQFETNQNLAKGITILEKTSQSLSRASAAARESEQIGADTLTELGGQKESLLRTRGRLDETNQNLRRTHLMLRTLHRRVLTNKLFLYLIVIVEILIGGILAYDKLKKKNA